MNRLRSSSGFSLVAALIAVSIVSIVILAIASLNYQARLQMVQTSQYFNIGMVQRNISSVVLDTASWANTIQNAPATTDGLSLSCLNPASTVTCAGANTPFTLYDGQNNKIADSADPNFGFDSTGKSCTTFGTNGCYFRYDIRWTVNCGAGPCTNPQILVTGQLVLSGLSAQKLVVNVANYVLPTIYRAPH